MVNDAQSLSEDLDADFIVLGSGMAGMTAAHYVASQGRKVVVIEVRICRATPQDTRRLLNGRATGRNTIFTCMRGCLRPLEPDLVAGRGLLMER